MQDFFHQHYHVHQYSIQTSQSYWLVRRIPCFGDMSSIWLETPLWEIFPKKTISLTKEKAKQYDRCRSLIRVVLWMSSIISQCFPGHHVTWCPGKHWQMHPGRFTWNIQIAHVERKMNFQTFMIMFHVNLEGCNLSFTIFLKLRKPSPHW